MSSLVETLKDMMEYELCDRDLEVYSCDLNGDTFQGIVRTCLDRDGDLKITLEIEQEDLCHYISPDVMKKYLIEEGYLEEEV